MILSVLVRFFLICRSFTLRKVYIALDTLLCFLQLSDRADVSQAWCIDLFLLVVPAPHDSNVVFTWKFVDCLACHTCHCLAYAPINVKPEGGGGVGHRVGILTFSKKNYQIHTPGQNIIVKISRNKWFTSLLLFETERSNAWCPIKIPILGICVTVKFLWVAPPRAWHW